MNYIQKAEFLQDMLESQKLGKPTDRYALGCHAIAVHLLGSRQFRKYSQELKEDLVSNAVLRSMKAIKAFDVNKTDNAFGYITRTAYTAFLQVLKDHYMQLNIKKAMMQKAMAQFDTMTSKDTLNKFEKQEWKSNEQND